MICARLLSNSSYHVALTPSGGGYSRWRSLAVSRWREDAALEDDGFLIFLHEESTGSTWLPVSPPPPRDRRREPNLFGAVSPAFANHVHGIATVLSVTVAAEADVELRRLRIFNRSAHPRTLAHLAFSKLSFETPIDPELPAIFASRRPSKPDDVRAWLFHRAVVHDVAAELSFDTDRAHFIGRGYGSAEPRSVVEGDALTGVAGSVLDAAAIIRADFTLEAGAAWTIDWFFGVGESPQACEALALQVSAVGFGDEFVRRAPRATAMLHEHIGIGAAVATQCERLAGGLLLATAGLRAPAAEIAGNRLGQAGLWPFGISGDVPIVVPEFVGETQVALLNDLLCAQAFWKAHGLASELMIIFGDPASASATRLLDLVRNIVGASVVTGSLDKPAGVYQLLVDSLLGFERRGSRLRLRPLLPRAWPGFTILYRFGSSRHPYGARRRAARRRSRTLKEPRCKLQWSD